jgi:pyruvate dehydrogenase E2 component (dihydrolipoamide acetyltransferase)
MTLDTHQTTAQPTSRREPLKGIRRTIAKRMDEAWRIPAFHLSVTVSLDQAAERRKQIAGASLTDVIVRDTAWALARHPELNAHFLDDAIEVFDVQHVGIAVATDQGLIVPVIKDVGALGDDELVAERARLVEAVRGGRFHPADVTGGTFTISNLGMYGIRQFDAILNKPQVAILAVGAAQTVVALEDGRPVERRETSLTLTCDHRAVDGATGAEFLQTLRERLERPA